MKDYIVTWNERVFFEAHFTTTLEEGSDEWWERVFEMREWVDSNGMDDINVEVVE